MAEQNLVEFYARAARIEKARAQGFGFEAEGALGRSHYQRPKRRRLPVLAPVVVLLLCLVGLKVALLNQLGAATYDARVSAMQAKGGIAGLGAGLMAVDPVTAWTSAQLQGLLR